MFYYVPKKSVFRIFGSKSKGKWFVRETRGRETRGDKGTGRQGDKGTRDKGTVLLSHCLQNGAKYDIIILPVRKSGVFDRRWLFFFSSFLNNRAKKAISAFCRNCFFIKLALLQMLGRYKSVVILSISVRISSHAQLDSSELAFLRMTGKNKCHSEQKRENPKKLQSDPSF